MTRKVYAVKLIRFFGDSLMLGIFFLVVWLFVTAYFNQDFATTIYINKFGEAHVEMILLVFILFPLFLLTAVFSFVDWKHTVNPIHEIPREQQRPYKEHYYHYPVGEDVVCPLCDDVFYVTSDYYYSRITCPYCGLTGTYLPVNDDTYF
jgi:hypothetical protein